MNSSEWSMKNICKAFNRDKDLTWDFMKLIEENPESAFEIWLRLSNCTVSEFICDTVAAYKPLLVPSLVRCYREKLADTPYGAVRRYLDPQEFREYTGRAPLPGKEIYIQMAGLHESDACSNRVLGYIFGDEFHPNI